MNLRVIYDKTNRWSSMKDAITTLNNRVKRTLFQKICLKELQPLFCTIKFNQVVNLFRITCFHTNQISETKRTRMLMSSYKEKEALTWITNSGSDSVTTLEKELDNPWSDITGRTGHTNHLSFPTHYPLSLSLSLVLSQSFGLPFTIHSNSFIKYKTSFKYYIH